MKVWFTSDTHFGHANIIRYCNRPFSSVQEMDDGIISNFNSVISEDDTVFHLGDFCFGNASYYLKKLKGNFTFIKGNHDKALDGFSNVYNGFYECKVNNKSFTLCHYAMKIWNKSHFGYYHLYGHSHGTLPDDPNSLSFDVGVDTNNFYPYSFDQVVTIMKTKTFVPIDHHKGDR